MKKLYLQLNEPGSGEITLPRGTQAAADAIAAPWIDLDYKGTILGGFLAERVERVPVTDAEMGGRTVRISGRGPLAILDQAIVWDWGTPDLEKERYFNSVVGGDNFTTPMIHKGHILHRLLTEALLLQTNPSGDTMDRKCFHDALGNHMLSWAFNDVQDSDGMLWDAAEAEDLRARVGATHLELFRQYSALGQPTAPNVFEIEAVHLNTGIFDIRIHQKPTGLSTTAIELITNGGFETLGGLWTWLNWYNEVGDGAIADEGALVHAGSHAAKLTAGASHNTRIATWPTTVITLVPGAKYTLSFWTCGDGTNAGFYELYDVSGGWTDIIPNTSTGITGTTYQQVLINFTTPAGCTVADLYFTCPTANGGICYFDDVSLKDLTANVHFKAGSNLLTVSDVEDRVGIRNASLVAYTDPVYPYIITTDPASILAYWRREEVMESSNAVTAPQAYKFGMAELAGISYPGRVITFKVSDLKGPRYGVDYKLGDWVFYEDETYTEIPVHLMSLNLEWDDDVPLTVTAEAMTT